MIKKTMQTLKKNPIILLGFAVPIVLMAIAVLPMVFGINDFMGTVAQSMSTGTEPTEAEMISFFGNYMITFALMSVLWLAAIFLALPPVYNKVYEACTGVEEKKWYSRGLKRSWWKVFVIMVILSAAMSVVGVVVALVLFIPILGFLGYIAALLAVAVFSVIAYTAVIAEDSFDKGLGGIFTVGPKYFFKQLGAIALVNIPVILAGIAATIIMAVTIMKNAYLETPEAIVLDNLSGFMNIMWIFAGVCALYGIFSAAFTYTHSMHCYIDTKAAIESGEGAPKEQAEQEAQ